MGKISRISSKLEQKLKVKFQALPIMECLLKLQQVLKDLVHISEISWTDRINDLSKHYKVGEEIEALVVSWIKTIEECL